MVYLSAVAECRRVKTRLRFKKSSANAALKRRTTKAMPGIQQLWNCSSLRGSCGRIEKLSARVFYA